MADKERADREERWTQMLENLSKGEEYAGDEWNLFNAYRDKAAIEFLEAERLRAKINELYEGGNIHMAAELSSHVIHQVNVTMMHIAMAELHRPRGN